MTGNWASRFFGQMSLPVSAGQPISMPSNTGRPQTPPAAPQQSPLPTVVNAGDIYQAARALAVRDHELDVLFNPEFYGEGI